MKKILCLIVLVVSVFASSLCKPKKAPAEPIIQELQTLISEATKLESEINELGDLVSKLESPQVPKVPANTGQTTEQKLLALFDNEDEEEEEESSDSESPPEQEFSAATAEPTIEMQLQQLEDLPTFEAKVNYWKKNFIPKFHNLAFGSIIMRAAFNTWVRLTKECLQSEENRQFERVFVDESKLYNKYFISKLSRENTESELLDQIFPGRIEEQQEILSRYLMQTEVTAPQEGGFLNELVHGQPPEAEGAAEATEDQPPEEATEDQPHWIKRPFSALSSWWQGE